MWIADNFSILDAAMIKCGTRTGSSLFPPSFCIRLARHLYSTPKEETIQSTWCIRSQICTIEKMPKYRNIPFPCCRPRVPDKPSWAAARRETPRSLHPCTCNAFHHYNNRNGQIVGITMSLVFTSGVVENQFYIIEEMVVLFLAHTW